MPPDGRLIAFAWLLVVSMPFHAQAQGTLPDRTGTWVFDAADIASSGARTVSEFLAA